MVIIGSGLNVLLPTFRIFISYNISITGTEIAHWRLSKVVHWHNKINVSLLRNLFHVSISQLTWPPTRSTLEWRQENVVPRKKKLESKKKNDWTTLKIRKSYLKASHNSPQKIAQTVAPSVQKYPVLFGHFFTCSKESRLQENCALCSREKKKP